MGHPKGAAFPDASASAAQRGALASASVLAEFGDEASEVAAQSPSVALTRGEVCDLSRDHDAALVAVEEGVVLISTETGNGNGNGHPVGRRIVVATGQRGVLLVPPGPDERLEALTSARITVIPTNSLRALLERPSTAEALLDACVEALRERQTTIRNCTCVRHSERVRQTLLQLARSYGHVVPRGVRIDFPLTHQLLADMTGSARETVSLAMSDLGGEGFLHHQHPHYVINVAPHELSSTHRPSDVALA